MTKQNTSPEDTVRRYMLFIESPNLLVDTVAVEKATQAINDATDPIEKLKAFGDLDRARNIEEAPLRDGFVSVAKGWADKNNIPASVFQEMKVPDDVLRAAGFEVDVKVAKQRGKTSDGKPRQRAKAVSVEEIKATALGMADGFLIATIVERVGGSTATIAKALNELIEEGKLAKLGPVPGYTGRGRAPNQYEVVKQAA